MRVRIIVAGAVTAAAVVLCASGVTWQVRRTQAESAARWPTPADEPPIDVLPLRPTDDGWRALEPLLADIDREVEEDLREAIMTPGPLIDPGGWVAVADQLDGLDEALVHPTITSPGIETFDDPFPELGEVLSLGRALCLRGWTSFESGMYTEAIDDMLATDLLGRRIAAGGQTVISVMTGVALQDIALTELDELLAVIPDPEAHAHAAAGLAVERSASRVRDVLLRECIMFEQVFSQFETNPALLTQTAGPDGEVSEPGIAAQLNRFRYDHDATVAQLRQNCRREHDRLALPSGERGERAPLVPQGAEGELYNQIGCALLGMGGPDYGVMVDRELRAQLHRDGLRLLTAARRHALAHDGQLPASSAVLVGTYLPGPVIDSFTGAPLEIVGGVIQTSQLEREWTVTVPE
ncbi:MAG: hypothetical protein ACI8S6_005445 [Myxococcota bacterium]|jgi:hypothetical protein